MENLQLVLNAKKDMPSMVLDVLLVEEDANSVKKEIILSVMSAMKEIILTGKNKFVKNVRVGVKFALNRGA